MSTFWSVGGAYLTVANLQGRNSNIRNHNSQIRISHAPTLFMGILFLNLPCDPFVVNINPERVTGSYENIHSQVKLITINQERLGNEKHYQVKWSFYD
jgi:hypothetical protein